MMMRALQAIVLICHMGHQMNVPRIKGTSYNKNNKEQIPNHKFIKVYVGQKCEILSLWKTSTLAIILHVSMLDLHL